MPGNPTLPVTVLLLLTGSIQSHAEVTGYVKSFAIHQEGINSGDTESDRSWQSRNSIRVMWDKSDSRTSWQLHYELNPLISSRTLPLQDSTLAITDGSYRLTDLHGPDTNKEKKHRIFQNLDRLNLQIRFDQGDLTIGRQAITLGAARFINPTDVFLPFNVQTFNQEYRIGVDALRYQSPLGDLGELDLGVVLGDDANPEDSALFLQLRGNYRGSDLNLAISRFAQQNMIGAGIQSALGNFGFWLEIATVSGDTDYTRTSIGLDFAFTESTLGQIEYHYNGAGSKNPADYVSQFTSTAYQRGGVFLLGKNYVIPSITQQLSPLTSLNLSGFINLDDDSLFLSLSTAFNIAENFYLDAGYYHFSGDEISESSSGSPGMNSEYGGSPEVAYISIRYYF